MSEPEKPEKNPTPSIIGAIWDAANWLAKRELLLRIFTVAVLIGVGGVGVVYAQDKYDAGLAKHDEPLVKAIKANAEALAEKIKADETLHAKQAQEREEDRKRSANMERIVMGIDLNMRLSLESRGIKPIDLPDAGQ